MRGATAALRRCQPGPSPAGTGDLPRLERPASPTLTLPDCAAQVPKEYVVVRSSAWWGKAALTMFDAGMIAPEDWADSTRIDPRKLAMRAFNRWVLSHRGTPTLIEADVIVSDDISGVVGVELEAKVVAESRGIPELPQDMLAFGLAPGRNQNWGFVRLREAITALEAAHPGLGETLAYRIEMELFRLNVSAVTPRWTLDYQRNRQWWGSDDEKEIRQQYENDGESTDFDESGIYTREQFEAILPPLVSESRERVSKTALAKLAKSRKLPAFGRELLKMLADFDKRIGKTPYGVFSRDGIADNYDGFIEQICPGVFLRWSNEDPTTDHYDDLANDYMNAGEGYYEGASGFDVIPIDDVAALREWMANAARYFDALRRIEAMLALIEAQAH